MRPRKDSRHNVPLLVTTVLVGLLLLTIGRSTWASPVQHQLRQTIPTRTPSKPPSLKATEVPPTPTSPPTATPTEKPHPNNGSPTTVQIIPTQEPTPAQLPETGASLPPSMLPIALTSLLALLLIGTLCSHIRGRRHP